MRRAAVPLLALIGGVAAADPPTLTPDQLRAELAGAPIAWWEAGGWRHGSLWLDPAGGAEIALAGPETGADIGRWRIEGDRLCTVWRSLRGGAEACYRVARAGEGRYATSGGNMFEVLAPGV